MLDLVCRADGVAPADVGLAVDDVILTTGSQQLLYLLGKVTAGDFAPTASDREVHQILHDQAAASRAALDKLVAADVAQFNATLVEKKLTGVVPRP